MLDIIAEVLHSLYFIFWLWLDYISDNYILPEDACIIIWYKYLIIYKVLVVTLKSFHGFLKFEKRRLQVLTLLLISFFLGVLTFVIIKIITYLFLVWCVYAVTRNIWYRIKL